LAEVVADHQGGERDRGELGAAGLDLGDDDVRARLFEPLLEGGCDLGARQLQLLSMPAARAIAASAVPLLVPVGAVWVGWSPVEP
jgi:hypothetical protein